MNIKDFINRMQTKNYYYIAKPEAKLCFELTDYTEASAYSKTFSSLLFDYFPYKEFNFDNPYEFMNSWAVLDNKGQVIEAMHYELI